MNVRERWQPLCVAGLAIAHAAFGLWALPQWMFSKYPDAARLLLDGRLRAEEGADFSPFYLLVNVLVAPGPLRWIQSALGALGIVAIFLIGRSLFGALSGFVGAVVFSLSAPVLLYEATLEPDLLVMALNLVAIALLLCAPQPSRLPIDVAAGAALGLSISTRPTAVPLLLLVMVWAFVVNRKGSVLRPWVKPLVIGASAIGLALVPPLVLRTLVGQGLGATMSVGPVFQQSNRPEGTGLGAQPPVLIKLLEMQVRSPANPDPVHGLYRRFARASAGADLSPQDVQRFWIGKTLAFALAEPGAYLALLYRKLCFFVFGPDGHDIQEVRLAAVKVARLPVIPTGWLGLMGMLSLGFLVAGKKRVGLLGLYVATTAALALGFYVVSRFRLATVPVWCVLIGGVALLVREAIAVPKRAVLGALVLVGAVTFALKSAPVRDGARMIERGAAAAEPAQAIDSLRQAGRLSESTDAFIRAQAAQPYVVLSRDLRGIPFEAAGVTRASGTLAIEQFGADEPADAFLAAVLAVRAGHCDESRIALDRAAEAGFRSAIFDVSLDPQLLAAECALKRGDRSAALKAIAASLESWPGTLDGLALAVAGGLEGDARADLFAFHDTLSARFALGKARLMFGDAAGALDEADAVLALLPEAGIVHYERARALAGLGRLPEAADAYGRGLELFPSHAFPGRPLDAAVEARLTQSPEDPVVLALASEHRLRAGDVSGARALASRAAELWGTEVPPSHQARQRFLATAR